MNRNGFLCVLAAVLMLCAGTARAQDIASIRGAYADAKRMAEMQQEVPEMRNCCEVTVNQNVPGIGMQRVCYSLLFSPPETYGEGRDMPRRLVLASCSFNVAARKCYEEYLFDGDGNPIFVFCRHDDDEVPGGFFEKRVYFGNGGEMMRIRVSGTSKGRDYVIYEGDGTGCPERYLNDDYGFAMGISKMFASIYDCIKS